MKQCGVENKRGKESAQCKTQAVQVQPGWRGSGSLAGTHDAAGPGQEGHKS